MLLNINLQKRNQTKVLQQMRKDEETGCWNWTGQISNSGYGRIMLKTEQGNITFSAHRASFALFKAPLNKDTVLMHICKNRLCINPEHMKIMNEDDNQ